MIVYKTEEGSLTCVKICNWFRALWSSNKAHDAIAKFLNFTHKNKNTYSFTFKLSLQGCFFTHLWTASTLCMLQCVQLWLRDQTAHFHWLSIQFAGLKAVHQSRSIQPVLVRRAMNSTVCHCVLRSHHTICRSELRPRKHVCCPPHQSGSLQTSLNVVHYSQLLPAVFMKHKELRELANETWKITPSTHSGCSFKSHSNVTYCTSAQNGTNQPSNCLLF